MGALVADLAKIGFAADTSGLQQAEAALNKLPPAAKAAETASDQVSIALDGVSAAAQGVAATTGKATQVINAATGATNSQATAVGKDAAALNSAGSAIDRFVNGEGKATQAINNATNAFNVQATAAGKTTRALQDQLAVQQRINALTGVSGGSNSAERAADVEAYASAMDDLRAKYNPLFAAQRSYRQNLDEIKMALRTGAISQTEYAAAMSRTKDQFAAHVRGINNAGKAYQGMSHDAKNLSYQIVDVTQGLLSGQPVYQIFAQQAGQIGQVIATSPNGLGGLMKELGRAIAGILTPARLLSLGLIAVGAASLYLASSIISSLKSLDDLSRAINVPISRLHELEQAASFKGITSDAFAAGMKSFADRVYEARQNMGDLNGLMIANNMQAKTFDQYLANVADLVSRSTDGMQRQKILEAAGLPTTSEWVRLMSQGSKGIAAAVAETQRFNDAAEQNLIAKARKFDEEWNKATTKISQYLRSLAIDGLSWIDQLSAKMIAMGSGVAAALAVALAPFSLLLAGVTAVIAAAGAAYALYKGNEANQSAEGKQPTRVLITGGTTEQAPGGKPVRTQAELLAENQQMQQRLSILGDMATITEQVKLRELELNAAGLQGVGVTNQRRDALLNATRAQAENNLVNQQAQAGIFNVALAQKAANDTLQMWIDKGIVDKTNTEQMAAAKLVLAKNIQAASDAAKIASAQLPGVMQLQIEYGNFSKMLDTTLVNSFNSLVTPIQDVLNGTTSLKDGFKNMAVVVLKAIQEMIIKMLILKPLMAGISGLFGGGGGFLSSLFGVKSAQGNVFANDNITPFANGGAFTNSVVNKPTVFAFASGVGLMGEAGPEAIMPLTRGPDGSLGVQMYGANSNNQTSSNQIVYSPSYQLGGSATQEDIENLKRLQAEDRARFTQKVASAIPELRRRGYKV